MGRAHGIAKQQPQTSLSPRRKWARPPLEDSLTRGEDPVEGMEVKYGEEWTHRVKDTYCHLSALGCYRQEMVT